MGTTPSLLLIFNSVLIIPQILGHFSETAKVRISLISAGLCQAASNPLWEKQTLGAAEIVWGDTWNIPLHSGLTQTQGSECMSYK